MLAQAYCLSKTYHNLRYAQFYCQITYFCAILHFQDTCYDEEDGGTEKLSLSLLTTNRRELAPDAWLQFDSRNQEFVGIPLEEEVGRTEYQLVSDLLPVLVLI